MTLTLGATAPDFDANTTQGKISFHEWMGDAWCMLFSHPKDFTPVCTTELGALALATSEFERRGVKLIGLSIDSVDSHLEWSHDIAAYQGMAPEYPIIGDPELKIAKLYGMLPADTVGSSAERTAMDNATARCVFLIGPDKTVKLTMTYPMTTGRSVAELLRVVDSVQLTATRKVATPAGWQQGEDVIIVPAVDEAEAKKSFPAGWKSPLPYMRIVAQPA